MKTLFTVRKIVAVLAFLLLSASVALADDVNIKSVDNYAGNSNVYTDKPNTQVTITELDYNKNPVRSWTGTTDGEGKITIPAGNNLSQDYLKAKLASTMPAPSAPSQLKLIQPDLVRQGETFTSVVVQRTPSGDVPLEGGQVVYQGKVIQPEPGGRITLPAFIQETGNTFIVLQVMRAMAGTGSTVTRHVEIVPAASNVPPRIAQASPIVNPGGEVWGTGQELEKMVRAALVDQKGAPYELGKPFGSSLQAGGIVPRNLPPGTYRFVAWDAAGTRYEAPNQSKCPSVTLEGPRITRRGQRGQITVLSDVDGTVLLSGGEPQIMLDEKTISVHANQPQHDGFTSKEIGTYQVKSQLVTAEGGPVSADAPRVDSKLEPLQTHYDPSRNQTQARVGAQVVDEAGHAVANAPVDFAVSHPNGVEYGRAVTDQHGHASFTQTFAGQLAADALSAHIYRVLGHAWKQDAECDCEDLTVQFDPQHKFEDKQHNVHQGIGAKVSKDRKKPDTVNVELAVAYAATLKCDEKDGRECTGQINIDIKSEWLHKPPEGVSLGKPIGPEKGKEFGVDPKGWTTISPDTESWDPKKIEIKEKCKEKKPKPKHGNVLYNASFSAGNTNLRGKVTITFTPICNDKQLTPWKIMVFVDGTNANGFDPDKSDYDGDGVDNAHDKFPMDPSRH